MNLKKNEYLKKYNTTLFAFFTIDGFSTEKSKLKNFSLFQCGPRELAFESHASKFEFETHVLDKASNTTKQQALIKHVLKDGFGTIYVSA